MLVYLLGRLAVLHGKNFNVEVYMQIFQPTVSISAVLVCI